jgi:hypothetical protein
VVVVVVVVVIVVSGVATVVRMKFGRSSEVLLLKVR